MRVAPLSWTTAAGWRPDTFVREEPDLILYSAAVRRWRRAPFDTMAMIKEAAA